MREVDVLGVRVEMPTNQPIVLLRERDGGRYLPIWIGAPEAAAITYAQQGVVPPRPLTHDLMRDILAALGHELTEVRIVALRDSVFHASLVIDGKTEISSRASDAIALAIRCGAPIYVSEAVLQVAGVVAEEEEESEEEEDEMMEQMETTTEPERPKTQRELLQGKLDEAVKNEDYERAAQIRDEIDRLG